MIWIWIILYLAMAAVSVFFLSAAVIKLDISDHFGDYHFELAVIAGVLWPIGMPVMGAALGAIWYTKREERE